jgi:hypothetical protein
VSVGVLLLLGSQHWVHWPDYTLKLNGICVNSGSVVVLMTELMLTHSFRCRFWKCSSAVHCSFNMRPGD